MKVAYISDMHIDFYIKERNPLHPKFTKQAQALFQRLGLNGGKLLIIAGDLGHYVPQDKQVLLMLRALYERVVLVRGNHDMYLLSNQYQKKYKYDSMNRVNEMKDFCQRNGIDYLDGNVIDVYGRKIGGVGMSWDDSYYRKLKGDNLGKFEVTDYFNYVMNDPLYIHGGRANYRIPLAYSGTCLISSWDQKEYFEQEKEKLSKIIDVDIMVSHYSPVYPPNMKERYQKAKSTTFYFFDGKDEVSRINPAFWIFGHTHERYDFMHNKTQFLCNPVGYPNENTNVGVQIFEI